MAAILCARLRENQIFTKKEKRALPSTRPAVASHKGASPLDPRRPPQIDVLNEENFVCLGKLLFYGYLQKKKGK